MKYVIPLTLVLLCAFNAGARAQEATSPVVADVTQALVLTSTGQTSFGTVPNTAHTETIDPTAPAGAQTTAEFGVSFAGFLSSVTLTCPSEITLTEPTSSAVITFTPTVVGEQSISARSVRLDPTQSLPQHRKPPRYRRRFTLARRQHYDRLGSSSWRLQWSVHSYRRLPINQSELCIRP